MPTIEVREIKQGDQCEADEPSWTALADASEVEGEGVHVTAAFDDGGIGPKVWSNPAEQISVAR